MDSVPAHYPGSTGILVKNIIHIIKRLDPILKKKFPGKSCINVGDNPECDIEFRFDMATPNPPRTVNLPSNFPNESNAKRGLYYIMPTDLKNIQTQRFAQSNQYKDPSFDIYHDQDYPTDLNFSTIMEFIQHATPQGVNSALFLVCNQEPAYAIPYKVEQASNEEGYIKASREQFDYDMNNLIAFLTAQYEM